VVGQWEPANRNFLYDHNLYWNASGKVTVFSGDKSLDDWRAAGQDKNSIVADPLFVDPEKGDFRLQPGSPRRRLASSRGNLMAVGPRRLPMSHGDLLEHRRFADQLTSGARQETGHLRRRTVAAVTWFLLMAGLCSVRAAWRQPAAANEAPTSHGMVLGIEGSAFTINGKKTFLLGASYYGALAARTTSSRVTSTI